MKKIILKFCGIMVFTILISSCEDSNVLQPKNSLFPEVSDCVRPDYLDSFSTTRAWYYYSKKTSHNGTYLLYTLDNTNRYYILNVHTGESKPIEFSSMLPKHLNYEAVGSAAFCSYDENKILFNLLLSTDTIGNGKGFVESQYLYVLDHDKNEMLDVSPKFFGKYGINPSINIPEILSWLNSSYPGNDNIFLRNYGKYNIQSQILQTPMYNPKLYISMSQDGKNVFRVVQGDFVRIDDQNPFSDGYKQYFFYLNNVRLEFDSLFITALVGGDLNFTQDGKYLVGSFIRGQFIPNVVDVHGTIDTTKIIPIEKLNTKEFFAIDVEKTLSSGKLVLAYNFSFKKKYCLYRVTSVIPLTNNSVTVSMSYDRYDIADIYEMSFDGRILRKLRK